MLEMWILRLSVYAPGLYNAYMQAASEHCVGMCKFQTCIFRKSVGGGMRRPVWFDAECKHKRRVFLEAVRTGQAVHACKLLKKEYIKRPGVHGVRM